MNHSYLGAPPAVSAVAVNLTGLPEQTVRLSAIMLTVATGTGLTVTGAGADVTFKGAAHKAVLVISTVTEFPVTRPAVV